MTRDQAYNEWTERHCPSILASLQTWTEAGIECFLGIYVDSEGDGWAVEGTDVTGTDCFTHAPNTEAIAERRNEYALELGRCDP